MNRRTFLTGLSTALGASLLAPMVRSAWAGDTPRRFVFVLEGNGTEPVSYMTPAVRAAIDAEATNSTDGRRNFPTLYGHSAPLVIDDDLSAAPSLDPLAGVGGALDLTSQSSVVLGLSSTVTGGGHTTNFGALSSTRSTKTRAGGPTIDAVLAASEHVRGMTPFDAIRLGVHSLEESLNTSTCAYAAGQAAPVVIDPTQAFINLFGVVGDASSQAAFARRGQLLDYAARDVSASLSLFSGNSAERAKLEAYLTSIETVQQRHTQLLSLSDALGSVVPTSPSASGLYESEDPFERLQAHFDLAQAALIGGLTSVAVLAVGTGGGFDLTYPSLMADLKRHDLHHRYTLPDDVSDVLVTAATRTLVDKAAGLARALAAVPEEGGSMLDNTLIIAMSENGETHHSSGYEWPILLIGGANMGFHTDGRTTVFPGVRNSANRQLSNFFNTLGHAGGLDLNTFGAEGASRIAYGPLSELMS